MDAEPVKAEVVQKRATEIIKRRVTRWSLLVLA
jgi:hypothetical protein